MMKKRITLNGLEIEVKPDGTFYPGALYTSRKTLEEALKASLQIEADRNRMRRDRMSRGYPG
jgi:hypothetical protein